MIERYSSRWQTCCCVLIQGSDLYDKYAEMGVMALNRSHLCKDCVRNQALWRKYKRVTERQAREIDTLTKAHDDSLKHDAAAR